MAIRFDCPHCKTSYEVADDLAGKWIMCRGCQKRGPVRTLAAGGSSSTLATSIALASANPSRRQTMKIVAGVLASVASITTGALLARRPWRHWGSSSDSSEEGSTERRGRRRGPPGPPGGAGGPPPKQ